MRTLLLLLLLALSACSKPGADPERTFRTFVDHVQRREAQAAWDLLAPESQQQLEELVRARSEASGGAIPNDPQQVVLGNAQLARPVEKIEVEGAEADTAVLRITSGGASDTVTMVRVPEGWRVKIEVPPELRAGSRQAQPAAEESGAAGD